MQPENIAEALSLLDERCSISVMELTQISGLSMPEIEELVEFGIFEPQGKSSATWVFSAHCIAMACTASRLRKDFDLNGPGIALALTYLQRIQEFEMRLRTLECQQLR